MRPLYTIQELAHTLRLQPGTVRNKLSRGEDLPRSVRVGRRRLFPEDGGGGLAASSGGPPMRLPLSSAIRARPQSKGDWKATSPFESGASRGSEHRKTAALSTRDGSSAQIALFDRGLE